MVAVTQNAFLF